MRHSKTTWGAALGTAAMMGLLAFAGTPATASTAEPTAAAAAKPVKEASLTGSATMDRGKNGDRVTFAFDARGFAPTDVGGTSRGTFRFTHHSPDGKKGAWFEGRIDCLLTGGPVATATGIIERTDHPDRRIKGKRVGFTVYDGGKGGRHDRVGYSWAVEDIPDAKVPVCLSAAPYETAKSGDFTVNHLLPPTPKADR
ncbi:hypothetical protein [Streptomyces purpureus]|uniref:Repetin n=1 Tax=Streptomyces purpureus TaxID=1951 RepID=A0A918LTZ5_9ACTN|nr:hypothetical protein [Streptomyces purpureus]GGT53085.1 hypothetical protein GCM10014713_53830 [Streptomyces purpureus]